MLHDIWLVIYKDSDENYSPVGAYNSLQEAKKKVLAIRKECSAESKIEFNSETSFFTSNGESCYIEETILHS